MNRKHHSFYPLDLSEWIPKKTVLQRESRVGRNCDVFDSLRFWAYKNFRNFGTKEQFITGTRQVAENLNRTFAWVDGPLTAPEIKTIAKSVATWTWEHRVEGRSDRRGRSFAEYVAKTHTPEIQRLRGLKSGAVRFAGSKEAEAPWVALGISRRTYYYRLKKEQKAIALEPNQVKTSMSDNENTLV